MIYPGAGRGRLQLTGEAWVSEGTWRTASTSHPARLIRKFQAGSFLQVTGLRSRLLSWLTRPFPHKVPRTKTVDKECGLWVTPTRQEIYSAPASVPAPGIGMNRHFLTILFPFKVKVNSISTFNLFPLEAFVEARVTVQTIVALFAPRY